MTSCTCDPWLPCYWWRGGPVASPEVPGRGDPRILAPGAVAARGRPRGAAPVADAAGGRAALVALGLLSVAIFVDEAPVGAQEAESTGVGISLGDLSSYPTHTTVDGFMVELTNLTATEEYQVTVSSDSDGLGIGGCGTTSQKATVTGVETHELSFGVYACAVGEATVTAEVRLAGASESEASISRLLTVEELPDVLIQADGTRVRAPPPGTVAKAGTPGIVPDIKFKKTKKSATEVHVSWGLPSDGGPDANLTGFGLKFWRVGAQEPPYENPLVIGPPPTPSEYTYTGLEPGATYNFRIHACNGVDSCGYWTNPPKQVNTHRVPKKPHTISVARLEDSPTSLKVSWSPEADTGGDGSSLTRFQVIRREDSGGYPPSSQAVTVGANARQYTYNNLNASTTYWMKVRSCNGADDENDDCSDWSVEATPDTTLEPPPSTKPGVVLNLRISEAYNGSLKVEWSEPSNATAVGVNSYALQRRSGSGAWMSEGSTSGLSKTIDGLANGTMYEVQVQACNPTECGDWSMPPASGTPSDARPLPPGPTLPPPANLNVSPLALRKARITWEPVSGASRYVVQFRPHGRGDWTEPVVGTATSGNVFPTEYVTSLDSVVSSTGSTWGFHNTNRFDVRVKGITGISDGIFSDPVSIIDTPITSANGHSPDPGANAGKASLAWTSLATLHTDAIFSGGTYKLKYRRAAGTYSQSDWRHGLFDQGTDPPIRGEVTASSATSHTLNSLTRYAIYAIQLLYEKDGHKVFSVRDSYVWLSEKAFGLASESIATFPVYGYPLTTKSSDGRSMEFKYYICADTFPSANPESDWVPFIKHAMLQWQYATDELVKMIHKGNSCIDYRPFLNDMIKEVRAIVKDGQVDGKTKMQIEDDIRDHWLTLIARFRAKGINGTKIGTLSDPDAEKSEIMMIRDGDWSDEAHVVFAFLTFGGQIGLGGCDRGCAQAARTSDGSTTSADIYLRESYHVTDGHGILQPVIQPGAAREIVCNTCPNFDDDYHRPYSSIVHEAGHAIGLGHPDKDKVKAAIMSYYTELPQCAPHPLDVMAIYALYQRNVNR